MSAASLFLRRFHAGRYNRAGSEERPPMSSNGAWLIVEDDHTVREMVAEYLTEGVGYDVRQAGRRAAMRDVMGQQSSGRRVCSMCDCPGRIGLRLRATA